MGKNTTHSGMIRKINDFNNVFE